MRDKTVSNTETLPFDPDTLRSDFPILSTVVHGDKPLVYFDNAATTQRPRQVIQTLVDAYEQHYANVHRGIHWLSEQSTDLYEEAREAVQRFINAAHRPRGDFHHRGHGRHQSGGAQLGRSRCARRAMRSWSRDGTSFEHRALAAVS